MTESPIPRPSRREASPLPARARPLFRRAIRLVERFLEIEGASSIALFVAATIALVWANSPFRQSYRALWHLPLGATVGPLAFERDLRFWVNDGLMTIFFFVVGLEIRREIHGGELNDRRRAALPFFAAFGGMIAPAALFLAFNWGRSSVRGWGVPMATDIAFALGALTVLGSRVPPPVRVLLLSLAIIDDVGAIVVIALFYSAGLSAVGFATMSAGLLLLVGTRKLGARTPWAYVPGAALAWVGALAAGVHPTLAGVAVGLMTPASAPPGRGAASPLEHIHAALHPWVAFGILPLFAFANAGVSLGSVSFAGDDNRIAAGVGVGFVLGKPLGIVATTWTAVRLGLAALPGGTRWAHVVVVGFVAGIGFTMALFVAELAFPDGPLLESTKLAVLAASGTAGALGIAVGRLVLPTAMRRSPAPP